MVKRTKTKNEPLLNRLARRVGRAAGRIASVTQSLSSNEPPVSEGNETPAKKAKSKRLSTSKRKASKKQGSVKPRSKRTKPE